MGCNAVLTPAGPAALQRGHWELLPPLVSRVPLVLGASLRGLTGSRETLTAWMLPEERKRQLLCL
jgi:hypothetical protein